MSHLLQESPAGTAGVVVEARSLSRVVRLADGRKLTTVDAVEFVVSEGESVAIVGRSGSGKTSLLALLGLLARPSSGSLQVLGQDVARLSRRRSADVRNRSIGFVFQKYSLLGHLTVAENVALPLQHGLLSSKNERKHRVHEMVDLLGLGDRLRSRPQELSGGEQQRVAIARALIRSPRLLLADEPTGALDVATGESVLSMLSDATRARGTALLIVTHDREVADSMDRRLEMDTGKLSRVPS